MGMLFTAFGCLASALTSSQIIAGVVCTAILIFHIFLGFIPLLFGDQIPAAPFFEFISSQNHLREFSRGLIDTRTIVFYLSTSAFFLFLTFHLLDFRRWKP
jgi:ABC-2 type transport system permease protein